MTASSMDVFALRDAVVREYKQFATSFTTIHADDIRRQVEAIYAEERYWPEPLIQINPNYRRTTSIDKLVGEGILQRECAQMFRTRPTDESPTGTPLTLYKHQEEAIALALSSESFVVTTGTGSGKSLCFFIPIVNAILAEKRQDTTRRTRAVIIYPMNALANSQLEELDKFVANVDGPRPITFARYTGQDKREERRRISENPPDILLTNFMMLELLMTRQDEIDRRVMSNCVGLRFLVLDELHTYRGRQGADVAMLVRRVRERLSPQNLQCIGTSATMASEGSLDDKKHEVAKVASKLFSLPIPESNVIVETLERLTDADQDAKSVRSLLGAAVDAGIPHDISNEALRSHPLAIWVETRLGIVWSDSETRWERAKPQTVSEAITALSADSGREPTACQTALRDLLLVSSLPERERAGDDSASEHSFFPFRLHQFFSGAGHAYSTLEGVGERTVTVDGQQFLPGYPEKRLYPVHFCRHCGHEYHPVRYKHEDRLRMFLARDIDDVVLVRPGDEDLLDMEDDDDISERELFGFVTPHAYDSEFTFANRDEDYPETWLEFDAAGNPRLKHHYRRARAREFDVSATGVIGSGIRAWFTPGKFRFCLRCGETRGGAAKDRNRLASLSAEGRSSATTVLVTSALRWMHGEDSGLDSFKRKLLGFTDNRQDAALQSGHFNDFLFVSLVRAGFLGALEMAGDEGIRSDQLGRAQQVALGFDRKSPIVRAEWLMEPDLRGFNLQDAEATLRQVLSYRVWFDQRRGWRYTNPNLEQLGLVQVDYLGLDELSADDELFEDAPDILRHASAEIRAKVYRALLDHLRQWMAIRSQVLDSNIIDQMRAKSHSRLRAPWGFADDEKPRQARWLLMKPPPRRKRNLRDEDLIVRSSSRSSLGKALRTSSLWGGERAIRDLKSAEFEALVAALLDAASKHGLVTEEVTPFDNQPGWKLNDACVRFRLGTPTSDTPRSSENVFFRDLYHNLSQLLRNPIHPLFGFEAREHTAQVDGENRSVREKRFRYGDKEQAELKADDKHLREIGEANRFLPVLFCSPTMELGVDIAELNAVYMRNIPPTPANYAQRSGRAGRSGQAALVLTYCSSQGPHDQYFFRKPRAMVHGEVRPPLIDLANRDLIDSHLQAIWLACTEEPLDRSIAKLLVLSHPPRPLRPEVRRPMARQNVAVRAAERIKRVLDMLEDELTEEMAPWYSGRDAYAEEITEGALERFERAFDRWRQLFMAAEDQRDATRRLMDDYTAPHKEKRNAQMRHRQAMNQINLLQKGTNTASSDFYTYRYLATEGFLPGYNFPRLPLMAYVPGSRDGRGRQTYLKRPRFLALSEFGPRSLVYHEGSAYRVVRALLSLGHRDSATADTRLPTRSVRICRSCGAGHFTEQVSLCRACNASLGNAEIVDHLYRIENVGTKPVERITANDEERQRQGFELQTTFEWAQRDHRQDIRSGSTSDDQGDILRLVYGAGATITRINKGLRRRANRTQLGFYIDPVSGYWRANDDEEPDQADPTAAPRQWIVPCVQDHKNALLLQIREPGLPLETATTLQHAFLRGIESVFQLEQGEILAEPMPTRDTRSGFLLYEAAEGGAGVLNRLVSEHNAVATVAREALSIMHFDVGSSNLPEEPDQLVDDDSGQTCVAACYRCLMSYYNQPDHEYIDRRDDKGRELLLRLSRAETVLPTSSRSHPAAAATGPTNVAARDKQTADWFALARSRSIPEPDAEPLVDEDVELTLIWRKHYVAATFEPAPEGTVNRLRDLGFEIVVLGLSNTAWMASIERLATLTGRGK